MLPILFGMFFVLAMCVVIYVIIAHVLVDKKVRNNVVNYDTFMMNYYFLLGDDIDTTIEKLSIRNVKDVLEYEFDKENLIITFKRYGHKTDYSISFQSVDGKDYMKVAKRYIVPNNISYLINSFFINKLDAKPVEYCGFEEL